MTMAMQIGVDKSERGWELTYSYNGGPFCMGPEESSRVYATRTKAEQAADRATAEYDAWNRRGLADAPHMDAA
jgi:hypothetical protein